MAKSVFDYPALAAVAAVVREGSFERAAHNLGVTPSAISQRIRALEERLGSIVIVRGHPCQATDLGRRLCAHIDQVRLLEADLAPALSLGGDGHERPVTLKVAVNSDSIATWFPAAVTQFSHATGHLLEFIIEDEAITADRLRSGEVIAAVSADPGAVQGCRTIELGAMQYLACCSPEFARRHFADGVNAESLNRAPCLGFERRDSLQSRWARQCHDVALSAPTHWVPSTFGFLNFSLSGLAWGMHPVTIARPHIAQGTLVEITPDAPLNVTLYWTVTRLHASALQALTEAVRRGARESLLQGQEKID